jgi:hypothetical protein
MLLIFPVLLLGYLLLGLAVSVGVARWSGRRLQSRIAPWLVFTVLFTVFFGDEIYGYWHWQHLCKTQGGLHVYKRVPVEGFFKDGNIGTGTAREYLKPTPGGRGNLYRFVEGKKNNRLYRYRAGPGDEFDIQVEAIDKPSSVYAMSEKAAFYDLHHAWSNERSIYNMATQERIGIARSFGYQGATVVSFLRAVTGADREGSASYCGDTRGFPEAVIPPENK